MNWRRRKKKEIKYPSQMRYDMVKRKEYENHNIATRIYLDCKQSMNVLWSAVTICNFYEMLHREKKTKPSNERTNEGKKIWFVCTLKHHSTFFCSIYSCILLQGDYQINMITFEWSKIENIQEKKKIEQNRNNRTIWT